MVYLENTPAEQKRHKKDQNDQWRLLSYWIMLLYKVVQRFGVTCLYKVLTKLCRYICSLVYHQSYASLWLSLAISRQCGLGLSTGWSTVPKVMVGKHLFKKSCLVDEKPLFHVFLAMKSLLVHVFLEALQFDCILLIHSLSQSPLHWSIWLFMLPTFKCKSMK